MKHFERHHGRGKTPYILLCAALAVYSIGCFKLGPDSKDAGPVANYSNEVLDKWISLQVRLMKDVVGQPNVIFTRPYAYSGIVAYESIAQGITDDKWLTINWNGLSGLPQAAGFKRYFWPQSLNAAMA